MSDARLSGAELAARARAIGIFVRDQTEQLLIGALELRDEDDQVGRARAIALLLGDAAERVVHEAVALLNSVTHSDIASFTRRLDTTQQRQDALDEALTALAQQHALTLSEMHTLRDLMKAVVAGLRAEGGAAIERGRDEPGA